MTAGSAIAWLAFLFPLAYSPGPGNAFFAAIGASKGLKAALPALTRYHVATLIVTALIGIGMGVTILSNPIVSKTLAAAGSIYVLWLAWGFIHSARSRAAPGTEPLAGRPIGFWSGAVLPLLNPKAYYIIAVMFTQFLAPPSNEDLLTVTAITAIFTVNNFIAFVVWALAGRALTVLFRGERTKQLIDYLFAATLAGVAIWMLLPLFTL